MILLIRTMFALSEADKWKQLEIELKNEANYYLEQSDFNDSQKQSIEDMFHQYYYALVYIVESIEIITKNTPK